MAEPETGIAGLIMKLIDKFIDNKEVEMAKSQTGIAGLIEKFVNNREFFESVGLSALTDEALARWSADILLKPEVERSWLEKAFLRGSRGPLSAAVRAGAEALKLSVEGKVLVEKATDAGDFGMAQQILLEKLEQRGMEEMDGKRTETAVATVSRRGAVSRWFQGE